MRSVAALCVVGVLTFAPVCTFAQIAPPKPGVPMPQAYFDRVADDKTAFQFENAWIQKAQRAREARLQYVNDHRDRRLDLVGMPGSIRQEVMVSGTVQVPVFLAKFSNTGSPPITKNDLQAQLFDGPWPTGTLTELYSEMSYGNLTLTGTVYDWVTLSQNDSYYDGGCNGLCASAKTGQFILEILQAKDGSVDFGQFDNDGPDGLPNSGDDDGYADFVAFVHPEEGGECGNTNIWSHRWVVNGWAEFSGPWQTNDARTGGGFIKVKDYVIQPALGCGGGMIEIGVFCHEFGHAFGLPDLYDTSGGGRGIGEHGLMGSGNWNIPTNPAHMSPWSKLELGWVAPVEVSGTPQQYNISSVETSPTVFQLNVTEEKFRRKTTGAISGSYSLHCGLTSGEANNRNWPTGAGYGNGWEEAIRRDFSYNGSGSVTLQYDIAYHTEQGFDFAKIFIRVNGGGASQLAKYHGNGSASGIVHDLTPYLSGQGPCTYQIIAEFTSDFSFSDEDGDFDSGPGGPFILDNISVTGGGENYSADFESHEAGWYVDLIENPCREFFLVENRSTDGQFDQAIHGEGLYIWHIEQNVANSKWKNTGGTSGTTNLLPAGVTLEEADGLRQLLLGVNRGDGGDVFPGTTDNRIFSNASNPSSKGHNGVATNVSIVNISDPGLQMTATMKAGYLPPSIGSISETSGGQNEVVQIDDIIGSSFVHGANVCLRDVAQTEYHATSVTWVAKTRLSAELDLTGVPMGDYDVVVTNPDGSESVMQDAFSVGAPVPVFIQQFQVEALGGSVELRWDIWTDELIQGFRVLRGEVDNPGTEVILNGGALLEPDVRRYLDEDVDPNGRYEYTLVVIQEDGSELRSQRVPVSLTGHALELFQNEPNPFNPTTRIRYSLPGQERVAIVIFDALGRQIRTLVDEVGNAGLNEVVWNATNDSGDTVATGVYFYQLRVGGRVLTKKLILLK